MDRSRKWLTARLRTAYRNGELTEEQKRRVEALGIAPGANSLASKRPEIAAEWHPTRNGDLKPTDVVAGSRNKAWWLGECGHEWESKIADRSSRGYGCPVCAMRKCGKTTGKAVACVETGEVFAGLTAAADAYPGRNRMRISNACKDPTRTAYGYHWRYAEEDDSNG